MADLFGLRRRFGGARQRQLEEQEQQVLGSQLRDAPVQPQPVLQNPTGVSVLDEAELERQERQRRLQIELERIRSGG